MAAAAGLLPLLIHFINRRRYRRIRWAAMQFLLAANKRNARRVRMEQWMVLLARVALVLLFGLAIARPYLPSTAGSVFSSARSHHVLVLDNSLSMQGSMSDGRTSFEVALQYARAWLDTLPRNDAVSLVTLSGSEQAVVDFAAYDRRMVKEQLASIEVSEMATDIEGAAAIVSRIINESDVVRQNRSIHIISDLASGGWHEQAGGRGQEAVAALRQMGDLLHVPESNLIITRVGEDDIPNVAVTDIRCDQPMVGSGFPVRVIVEISNFGSQAVRELVLQIRRGGEIVRRRPLETIPARGSTMATMSVLLPVAGTHLIEARVAGMAQDALAVDDSRYLSLEVRDALPVLLVDGKVGSSLLSGASGYLATALSPRVLEEGQWRDRGAGRPSGTLIEPKVVGTLDLIDEVLSDYDVIALCDVQRLARESWDAIGQFVSVGGGLIVAVGPQVSTENYNRYAFDEGQGLLPGKWRPDVVEQEDGTTFSTEKLVHPMVLAFADYPSSGLFLARVQKYLKLDEFAGRAETVLAFETGDAALLASTFGRGRVLTYTTSVNMDWNNLPARGDFVSLMLSSFGYLSPTQGVQRNTLVGERLRESVTPAESSLNFHVHDGSGAEVTTRLVQVADNLAVEFGPVLKSGSYTCTIGNRTRHFAVNTDRQEADLQPLRHQELTDALDGAVRVQTRPQDSQVTAQVSRAGEFAYPLLCSVLLLLMVEMWMAYSFGSRRAVA
jgi:hypothetical protein